MTDISATLRQQVEQRANGRCEYCGLSQIGQEARFHIDHVIPVIAGGETTFENLAVACVSCSLRKGHRQTGVDPESGKNVPLFHPRRDRWTDHFQWDEVYLVGLTPTGRATIDALRMNRRSILWIREEEMLRNRHPHV